MATPRPGSILSMDQVSTLTGKEQIPLVDETGKNVRVDAELLYGKSAYQLAKDAGYTGTEAEWIASQKGKTGDDGKTAFELAQAAGFQGTEAEWLASLVGKSAYQVAKDNGFKGTEAQWLASLDGKDGMLPDFAVSVDANNVTEADFYTAITDALTGPKPTQPVSRRTYVDIDNDPGASVLSGFTVFPTATGRYLWAFGQNANGNHTNSNASYYKPDNGDFTFLSLSLNEKGDKGKDGTSGADGKSAYELAVAAGYTGTQQQWLDSLKGVKGDTGLALNVIATLSDKSELPAPGDYPKGSAFVIKGHWWADLGDGQYTDLGSVLGPEGKSAYEVAVDNGFQGTESEWLISLKGQDGIGLRILGSFASTDNLPTQDMLSGDAYIIQSVMYVWDTTKWSPVGQQGPAGASAYDVALKNGFVGSQVQWLASLVGQKGDQGIQGEKGDPGKNAAAINTKGKVANEAALPTTGNTPGDGYFIDLNLWIWTGSDWEDVGVIKGEKGDKGDDGAEGKQGPIGPQGKDIYALAVENGFTGNFADFLAQYKGQKGDKGNDGPRGLTGPEGKSAYDVAKANGYTGTAVQWLASLKGAKGDMGAGITVLGTKADSSALPTDGSQKLGDAYIVGTHVWFYNGTAWVDGGEVRGPAGKSAYELAVDGGFTGTVDAWLTSLKGADGKDGAAGPSAYEVAKSGGFTGTEAQWLLSLKGTQGDTGKSAYEIAQAAGYKGTETEWLASLKGTNGIALNYKGLVTAAPDTTGAVLGDAYLLQSGGVTKLVVFQDGAFKDAGKVQGDAGKSAYQSALDSGFQGTEAQWIASLKGDAGKSAYQVAVDAGFQGNQSAWLATLVGKSAYQSAKDAGYAGTEAQWLAQLQGAGLTPKGGVANKAALDAITGASKGDTYIVAATSGDSSAGHMFVYNGNVFVDLGNVRGDKGDKGDNGGIGLTGPQGKSAYQVAVDGGYTGNEAAWLATLVGPNGKSAYDVAVDQGYTGDLASWLLTLKGDKGEKGDIGPGVSIMGKKASSADLPATGEYGQGYLISGDFWGWTGSQYENLGPIQGPKGDTGLRGLTGIKGDTGEKGDTGLKGDTGTLWIVRNVPPQAADGRINDYYLNSSTLQFYQKTSATLWSPLGYLGGGNVNDADHDGNRKVRYEGGWENAAIQADVASTDQGVYLRQNGKWTRLNRYDVAIADSTGAMDVSAAQLFRISGTGTATISFTNLPTNRAMTFVIVLSGKGGSLTWPSALKWSNNEAPTLGDTRTNIVVLWDGTNLTAATGLVV